MRLRACPFVVGLALVPVGSGSGQTERNRPNYNSNPVHYRVAYSGPFRGPRVVITGAPYSAHQVSGMMRRSCDEWLYRDAEGRTRSERPMFSPPTSDLELRLAFIVDPVGGYQYILDTVNKIAHRIKSAPAGERTATVHELDPALQHILDLSHMTFHFETLSTHLRGWPAPAVSSMELGTRWIDGVPARGVRMTLTYVDTVRRALAVTTEA